MLAVVMLFVVLSLLSVADAEFSLDAAELSCGELTHHTHLGRQVLLRLPLPCPLHQPVPLAVLIHCYGCSAAMEMRKFAEASDALGVALLAPSGKASSFNAPSCCGDAHRTGEADVEFIDTVVGALLAAPRSRFVASAIYASGFSNGGFLASHLADASRLQWAAIATQAGHEYEIRRAAALPVHISHCARDSMVKPQGCCIGLDGEPTCCCGVVAPTCVSTHDIFARWLRTNGCSGSRAARGSVRGATCEVGIDCAAETALCMHDDGCYHQQWSREFPATLEVVAFFARQACTRHGGTLLQPLSASGASAADSADLNATRRGTICRCAHGRTGQHCLESSTDAGRHGSRGGHVARSAHAGVPAQQAGGDHDGANGAGISSQHAGVSQRSAHGLPHHGAAASPRQLTGMRWQARLRNRRAPLSSHRQDL